ncbi:MAG: NADH-quinone oxidoreductase subunit H [Candidatus Marsarchaeota archaeon]|nr:NADH-quinone oxidoreductase subunit H [Candidatus Marsarchaeota archaeon]
MIDVSSTFIGNFYKLIYSYLTPYVPALYANVLSFAVSFVIFAIILSVLITLFVYFFSWGERKIMGRMQSRHGPTYTGPFGILQNMADVVKLLSKEKISPNNADKPLFGMILPIVYALFVFAFAFVPLTPSFVGINTTVALVAVFLILSFIPMLLFLAGWTSGNKFGSISAQRSVIMLVSYELPLILVIASVALASHGFSFMQIVSSQSHVWYALLLPIGFVLFFIIMLAELERPPFDIREADNELIAGWLTDVPAPYYGLALFLDYTRLFIGTLLISILFLGGWNGPLLPPFAWIAIKIVILTLFIITLRATTVRMAIRKLLHLGWLYLLPLAVLNLFASYLIFVWFA